MPSCRLASGFPNLKKSPKLKTHATTKAHQGSFFKALDAGSMMLKKRKQPVAVLGAGASGLAASLELMARGRPVHLIESHSVPGGSASWFRRSSALGSLQFDAGATVLDGLDSGAWLAQSSRRWSLDLESFERMPRIFYKLRRHEPLLTISTSSPQAWLKDLAVAFPDDRNFIEQDLRRLGDLAKSLRKLAERRPHFPVQGITDLWQNLRLLPALPAVLATQLLCGDFDFASWCDTHPHSARMREWIEMNLLITVQCSPRDVFTPWAALALSFYPQGAGTMPGGMRGFMEPALRRLLSSDLATVSLRRRATRILHDSSGFWITIRDDSGAEESRGPFSAVVSGLSRFDTARIAPPGTFTNEPSWEMRKPTLWGANTAYVAFRDQSEWPSEAFNVHSKLEAGEGSEGNDAYLSVSKRNDTQRAPMGYRVATLSTHTRLETWEHLSSESYAYKKTSAGAKLLEHLDSWAGIKAQELVHTEFGTPRSFEHYTGRRLGHVGGLAMTQENTLRSPSAQRTTLPGLYQIGDTSFPGQSVYACALGAVSAVDKLESET